MSKVLPITLQDRPELNLRQGIKSSLKGWKPLISSLYLFYLYVRDGGEDVYSKEIIAGDNVTLDLVDSFSNWIDDHCITISNAKVLVKQSSLFLAQMEHLQVGLELFLKLAKVQFVDGTLSDSVERTGGNRYAKRIRFSTNMKVLADMIGMYPDIDRNVFLEKWLNNSEDSTIGPRVKEVLVPFTEECQFKIRTISNEIFFQQDGIYAGLRNTDDTVESADARELVGPFRILKSFVREDMHPYILDSSDGFKVKCGLGDFMAYADMVQTTLALTPKRTIVYQEVTPTSSAVQSAKSAKKLQKITYGAPGTGKSHEIEEIVGAYNDTVRTTFHPDSDYATFVGCYKPTMVPQVKYGLQGKPIEQGGKEVTEDVIAYSYVPQAFTKAYVRAWRKMIPGADGKIAPQFLVIEEINRGNCAQIFGDLFQLLDRDGTGYSKYAIEADSDLAKHIAKELTDISSGIPSEICSGKILKLPPNLYIWATMNTSDQSLFPMDSAFKRRWEWEYIPIKDAGKDWKIVADGVEFKWWDFIKVINKYIFDTLRNEDKQLGYFFARPDDDMGDKIEASKFVNKVLFYLYNDVFKDYDLPKGFAKPDGKGKFTFGEFFLADGKPNEPAVKELLTGLLA